MTSQTARVKLQVRDKTVVETALPAYMLCLMVEQVQKLGIDLRADVVQHLGRAAALPLAKVDELSVSRLARQLTDAAETLLHDLSPDDPRHGLYCCAMFCLKLVDEGRFPDARNQSVLVSMLLIDDLKDERPDTEGELAVWKFEETKLAAEASKLIARANLMGFYLKDIMQVPARLA